MSKTDSEFTPSIVETSIVKDIEAIIEKHSLGVVSNILTPDGVEAMAHFAANNDVRILNPDQFDAWRPAPRRRKGAAALETLESLIDHVNRFSDPDSALFAEASPTHPKITALFNYHCIGADSPARFGDHRSVYAFPISEEWEAWKAHNGKVMPMGEFAAFIEDRLVDVQQILDLEELPEDVRAFAKTFDTGIASPAKLLEMSRGMQVNEASVVKQVQNLSTGEAQIVFESTHSDAAGQPIKMPGMFVLAIPVFKLGALYRIAARLRYRKMSSGLHFWFDLWRPDRSFDHAFREACVRAQVETNLPLFFGKPE